MFAVSVSNSLLGERLDAGFYRPAFLSMEKALKKKGAVKLDTLVDSVACGPFGGNAIADELYAKDGVAFIRPVNISSHVFDDSSLVRVPKKNLAANGLKIYQGTNIYFGRVGDPCVAIIEGESSISPNIIIACTKGDLADPYYIYSFAASSFGLQQLKRQLKTVAQPTTSTDAIRELMVFKPEGFVQKYIGDKVRQAERLRTWAKVGSRVPALIDAILVGEIPERVVLEIVEAATRDADEGLSSVRQVLAEGYLEGDFSASLAAAIGRNTMGSVDIDSENFHVSVVNIDDVDDFLSAQTYRPPIISAYSAVTAINHCKLQNLCTESIRQGATPHFSEAGRKCIKSKQTRDIYIEEEGCETVDPSHEKNERIIRLQENDVLVTRQDAGTVGRASIFLDLEETYITDSLFLVRIDSSKADPGFVVAYLRTYTGQRLIEKGVYGSTGQLNLSSTSLRNLPIADFDIRFQRVLGEQIRVSDKATKLAKRLTNAAKLLVEDLIEGQITEAQLIAAEQALQAGNDTLDRKILSRLKTDGIDGEGAALFSDLDELYRLLALAEVE